MSLSVLFVCTANICRSPFMELYVRARAGAGAPLVLASAGTHGYVDRPMHPPQAAELTRRGIDPSAFRSRPLSAALLDEADLVLTAERSHRAFVLEEHPAVFRKTFTLGHFASLAAGQEPGGDLFSRLAGRGGTASADHDVADPYARGAQAASVCADALVDLIDPLVPALAAATLARGAHPPKET